MLNEKGIYYGKLVVQGIDDLKDKLISENILKSADLGVNSSLADISSSVSTEFSGGSFASIIVEGYSKILYKNLYHMGQVNLDSSELAPAYNYFKELRDVFESSSLNKPFNYYKKYRVWALQARSCIRRALDIAEAGIGVPNKQFGSSYAFEAKIEDVINFSGTASEDFTKVGLKLPGNEGKYIEIETNELFKEKSGASNVSTVNVILNVIYNDDKERNSKIYPVATVYNNKKLETVKMISANDLIEILKNDYKAVVSNTIVDNEILYKKLNEVGKQSLKPAFFFATGKSKVHPVCHCEYENSWPAVVLRANNVKDLNNISLYTIRSLEHALARKNQKREVKTENSLA